MDNTTREKNWDWKKQQPWVKRIYKVPLNIKM
jgi:hypothetical protein